MISGHRGLEINEILQVIPRGLAELAQLFHAIHCHHDTGYAGSHRLQVAKLIGLCFPAASSSEELPSASCRFQLLRTKILLLLRQAQTCPFLHPIVFSVALGAVGSTV